MTKEQILDKIRLVCKKEYGKIEDWVHDVDHVKGVVRLGKMIAKKEKVDPCLVQIACWLHDLGRVRELQRLDFKQSNHAEVSYELGREILRPFISEIGEDNVEEILLAVREHSLPKFDKAGKNKIAQILRDADRGMGLCLRGIYTTLVWFKIVDLAKPRGTKDIRDKLEKILDYLRGNKDKSKLAIEKLEIILGWYEGVRDRNGKWRVEPLCTEAAKMMFYKGYLGIKNYIKRIKDQR